ncbi:Peroxidase 2 [Capsicum annuum]|nr:Peroxidase 2 [Capsicum annuum]
MASLTRNLGLAFLCVVFGFVCFSNAQLSSNYYGVSCPNLQTIVSNAVRQAVNREARLGASILRLFFHDCFVNLEGPSWEVQFGRRDARTASLSAANTQLPQTSSSLSTLISLFSTKGLSSSDMTALLGSHTIGQAGCTTFRNRIYNETNIDSQFATTLRATCPASGGDANLASLDVQTPEPFR